MIPSIPVKSLRCVMVANARADHDGITISIDRIDDGKPVPSWAEMRLTPLMLLEMLSEIRAAQPAMTDAEMLAEADWRC